MEKSDTTTKRVSSRARARARCVRSTHFQNTLYLVQSGVLCNMLILVCVLQLFSSDLNGKSPKRV